MERKIGEIFEYNGEWYQCVEGDSCGECSLFTTECGSGTKSDLAVEVFGECSKVRRTDNKPVIFKKLEKVGEPFAYTSTTDKIYNVLMQQYKVYYDEIIPFVIDHFFINNPQTNTIAIEIKQNEEDMEEKKLNLKPFDIQKAREGKPVCTRDGRKARIICFDTKGDPCPIIALVEENNIESAYHYDKNGQNAYKKSGLDLMMLPEKKEGWINIYDADTTFRYVDGRVYETKDEAVQKAKEEIAKELRGKNEYVDTIKINWSE